MVTKRYIESLSREILGAAIEVHKALGPGLLERTYQRCLFHELEGRKFSVINEMEAELKYKDMRTWTPMRCDLFVEKLVVIEIKSVSHLLPVHTAQTLTYMKLLKAPKGLLINFNCRNIFREGQRSLVNEYFRNLPD